MTDFFTNQLNKNNISLGINAGLTNQSTYAIAIGYNAGQYSQQLNSIAIGYNTSITNQGTNSIAIGYLAGSNQSNNSIIINASGNVVTGNNANATYIAPIRNITQTYTLGYDITTNEISYFINDNYYNLPSGTIWGQIIRYDSSQWTVSSTIALGNTNTIPTSSIAMGFQLGLNQQANAIAIGNIIATDSQQTFAVSIGSNPNTFSQYLQNGVAIGYNCSYYNSTFGTDTISIGNRSHFSSVTKNIAIGNYSGRYQYGNNVAIGYQTTGSTATQWLNAVSIGHGASYIQQFTNAISIGVTAGYNNQPQNSIAIGTGVGVSQMGTNVIGIGIDACRVNYSATQYGTQCIIIGNSAGNRLGSSNIIAIGTNSSCTRTTDGLSIGYNAGSIYTGNLTPYGVEIGYCAGQYGHSPSGALYRGRIAIGTLAGQITQGDTSVAIGYNAGKLSQSVACVAIGTNAGLTYQYGSSVAIGFNAGSSLQNICNVAIGCEAGYQGQSDSSVCIGTYAGRNTCGYASVCIGYMSGYYSVKGGTNIGQYTGYYNQTGTYNIAIGNNAGVTSQLTYGIAIGYNSGSINQGVAALAIGSNAGSVNQDSAVAIGTCAGQYSQGFCCIAIGAFAGQTSQPEYSIIINASGIPTTPLTTNSFYIRPIRGTATSTPVLTYDATNFEICYNTSSIKYKKNVIDLTQNTSNVLSIRAREYDSKDNNTHHIGYIAEELNDIDPWFTWKNADNTPEGIEWFNMLIYTIEELKKIKQEIIEIKNETSILENK